MVGRVTFTRPSFPGDESREAVLSAVGSTDWPATRAHGHGGLPSDVPRAGGGAWAGINDRGAEGPGLGTGLGGAALLFLWNRGASGWANAYSSAAALAGSQNWVAMLFGPFDASNAITVDKTPASLW